MQPTISGTAVRVLCYGDSLTAGYTALTKYTGEYAPWATHLGDALGLPVDHVGMCGWTTEQMVDGLDGEANVDVCDVAHRGLRRLLEEGGYTHVRQHGYLCPVRSLRLGAPLCSSYPAACTGLPSGHERSALAARLRERGCRRCTRANAAVTRERVPISGAAHGRHERPEATQRRGDHVEPRAAARNVPCRRRAHACTGHPAQ